MPQFDPEQIQVIKSALEEVMTRVVSLDPGIMVFIHKHTKYPLITPKQAELPTELRDALFRAHPFQCGVCLDWPTVTAILCILSTTVIVVASSVTCRLLARSFRAGHRSGWSGSWG
jgi:hypothetical protein